MCVEPEELATKDEDFHFVDNTPKDLGRTFRDGIRKIDLILVVKDEENIIADSLKNNFFTNIVKMGLEVEYENGVLPIHKKLVFFKVHCPNDVLNNLGNAFGVKCVQSGRAERLMTETEREWINLVRSEYPQPLQYSSLDRSLVVYMTLLNVAFGDRQNYIGLERLMNRNIVIDAYALHDGPYFIPAEASNINARQILFYNWVGIRNVFKRQPLNLVHEYFGPKIALYFAYYGIYNLALAIASLGALIALFLSIFKNDNYTALTRPICEDMKSFICYKCFGEPSNHSCYFISLAYMCHWYRVNVLVDNKYTHFFEAFIILWGMFFAAYWLGREQYLNWIWQAHNKEYNRKQTRPEFEAESVRMRKSNKTGITIISKSLEAKLKILLYYGAIILLEGVLLTAYMKRVLYQDKAYQKAYYFMYPEKLIYIIIGSLLVVYVLDLIERKIANYVVKNESHKTYKSYSRSLAKHLYFMCFLVPFTILVFYGFQVAHFEFWRGFFERDARTMYDDTCIMTACVVELSVAFTIALVIRFGIFRKLSGYSSLTDYNQRAKVENVPCWEREYILPRFKEDFLMNKMKILVMQFTLIATFAFAFPPAILIVLFFNVYDLRRDTELVTLHYRRPLLMKDNAFNIWSKILKLMVYLAIVTGVVTLICSTDSIETYLREQRDQPGPTLDRYFNLYFKPKQLNMGSCQMRAYAYYHDKPNKGVDAMKKDLTIDELRTYQYMYIFIFEIVMTAIFLILQNIFTIDVDEMEIPKKPERKSEMTSESRTSSMKEVLE